MAISGGIRRAATGLGILSETMNNLIKIGISGEGTWEELGFALENLCEVFKNLTPDMEDFSSINEISTHNLTDLIYSMDLLHTIATKDAATWNWFTTAMIKQGVISKKEVITLKTLWKQSGALQKATFKNYKTLLPYNRAMEHSRYQAYALLPAMFSVKAVGQILAPVYDALTSGSLDWAAAMSDVSWSIQDVSSVAAAPISVAIDTVIPPIFEWFANWLQSQPPVTQFVVSIAVIGSQYILQATQLMANLIVSFFGLSQGIASLATSDIPLLSSAAKMIMNTFSSVGSAALSMGLAIGAGFAAFILLSSVLNALPAPLRGVASAILIVAGAIMTALLAVWAWQGAMSWGLALPLIGITLGAAAAGVAQLASMMAGVSVPHLQSGGIIQKGGVAQLHQGEQVVPAKVVKKKQPPTQSNITVYINGTFTSQHAKEISEMVGKELDKTYNRSR